MSYLMTTDSAQISQISSMRVMVAAAKPRFVVGALGPTNKTLSISPNVNDPGYRAVTFDDGRRRFVARRLDPEDPHADGAARVLGPGHVSALRQPRAASDSR